MSQAPVSSVPSLRDPGPADARKRRAAMLGVISNALLILAKIIAGTLTGSVAILTEAIHSSIDLVASTVTFLSVRKAGEPADEDHRYGHDKLENLSAAIEGVLILVGATAIAFEAIRHLVLRGTVHEVGLGIAVAAISAVANLVVSARLELAARSTDSPALQGDAAHLRTDALTSLTVLAGLVLVALTGHSWIDPVVALIVSAAVLIPGARLLLRSTQVLVDQSLPEVELEQIRAAIAATAGEDVVGFHELRTRRAGSRRYIDLHLQFRAGTSLEVAHRDAHRLQDAIAERLRGADVLIHLEPEDRVRPGERLSGG